MTAVVPAATNACVREGRVPVARFAAVFATNSLTVDLLLWLGETTTANSLWMRRYRAASGERALECRSIGRLAVGRQDELDGEIEQRPEPLGYVVPGHVLAAAEL